MKWAALREIDEYESLYKVFLQNENEEYKCNRK